MKDYPKDERRRPHLPHGILIAYNLGHCRCTHCRKSAARYRADRRAAAPPANTPPHRRTHYQQREKYLHTLAGHDNTAVDALHRIRTLPR